MKKKELKQEIERLKSVIDSDREKLEDEREKSINEKIMLVRSIIKSIEGSCQMRVDYERDVFNNLVATHYTFNLTV